MRRICPTLTSLQCFEAAARHASFTRAAAELYVTQGAVSRQISALETHLGIALFQRLHHHLVLTDAGQSYLGKVRSGLNMLESATAELLTHRGRGGLLNMSIPPTLATSWLIPRLHRFNALNPDITLNFIHYLHTHDFAMPGLDVAIQYGEGVWPNAVAHYITGRRITAICGTAIARKIDARDPPSLMAQTRLHHIMVPSLWQEWFDALGAHQLNGAAGPRFDQFSLIIKAALVGFGVGMVPRCLVQDELARGTLVEVFPQTVLAHQGYYLCYPPEKQPLPALQALQRWLLGESEHSGSVSDELRG